MPFHVSVDSSPAASGLAAAWADEGQDVPPQDA